MDTSDAIAAGIIVLALALFGLLGWAALGLFNQMNKDVEAARSAPCSYFAAWRSERVPARCAAEYGLRRYP